MKALLVALALLLSAALRSPGSETVIYLIRHAEPDEQYYALSDRGRADARRVGELLADLRIVRIYTSPKERTRQTAEIMAPLLGLGRQDISLVDGLDQDEERQLGWVAAIDAIVLGNQGKSIAIVTHHPVITAYALARQQEVSIDFGAIIRIARDGSGILRFQQLK